jgi:hypothetical protein
VAYWFSLEIRAVRSSEMELNYYQTTRRQKSVLFIVTAVTASNLTSRKHVQHSGSVAGGQTWWRQQTNFLKFRCECDKKFGRTNKKKEFNEKMWKINKKHTKITKELWIIRRGRTRKCECKQFGAFAELRQATISFVMSVRPSASSNSAPTGRIFIIFDIWVLFENLPRKFKFH